MSIRNLFVGERLFSRKFYDGCLYIRNFSRKSNNIDTPYKLVGDRRASKEENRLTCLDPNFELLAATNGFPFILPGNIGMAWYDTETTVQNQQDFVMEQLKDPSVLTGDIVCNVQTCPTVLRKAVHDLFPYRNFETGTGELSVVTISLKPNLKLFRNNQEIETERLAQTFVLTAKSVCDKLRNGGYWADFINPFSGRPYLYPLPADKLYEADEKFRCLDFEIFDIKDCKIVSNEQESTKRKFIGSLFTNAPSKKNHLNHIFTNF